MKNSLLVLLTLSCLFGSEKMQAQDYNMAIGARLGSPISISFKTHLSESSAIEVIAGRRGYSGYGWWNVGAAYQIHKPLGIDGLDGLQYYYGVGGSAYFWNYDNVFLDDTTTSFGVQGYLGLQYTFEDLPITLTADWIPTYFISSFTAGFGGGYGGVGIRYVLNRG